MAIKFFGQYLLEQGVINSEQLLEAITLQEEKNLKFGEYALAKGFVTEADVTRIKSLQQTEDLYFGEAAVRLEILTDSRVAEILQLQNNDHLYLGEALVQIGHLDDATVDEHLQAFRQDQDQYSSNQIEVPAAAGDMAKSAELVIDLTEKMLLRVADIRAKAGAVTVGNVEVPDGQIITAVRANGSLSLDMVLTLSEDLATGIAGAIVGPDLAAESRDIVIDSIREFVNIVSGNVIAKLVQSGASLELEPPRTLTVDDPSLAAQRGVSCELASPEGNGVVIVLIK